MTKPSSACLSTLLLACSASPIDDEDATADGSSSAGSASASASASISGTSAASSADSSGTTSAAETSGATTDECEDFGDEGSKSDVGQYYECDIFAQDCRRGWKCVPPRVCEPIARDPIPVGEPCDTEAPSDPCDASSWCAMPDPDTGLGTCLPQCTGSANDPMCPPDMICVMSDRRAHCAPPCDPFGDECASWTCQPTSEGFACQPSGTNGAGDGCGPNSCGAGLACRDAADVPGCCDSSCCAALCSDEHPCETGSCIPLDPATPGPDGIGTCG